MRCSGCGKRISFRGVACSYCGSEKASDRKKVGLAVSSTVAGGLIGAGTGGVLGAIIGTFLGAAGGTVAGLARYGGERYLPKVDQADGVTADPVGETGLGAHRGISSAEAGVGSERKNV